MRVELPQSLEVIPPATYSFVVDNVESKTSAQDKPYLNMTYKIVDDEEYAGRKVFDIISLDQKSLWRLKQFSLATGIDIDTTFDTEDFLGAEFDAVLDIEKGQLKPGTEDEFYPDKNRVKSFVFSE